jgi:two-component system, NarL family, nitrate/nitrite response regulator NarL
MPPTPPIRVALSVSDAALRERIVCACDEIGAVAAAAEDGADLVLADRPPATAVPVIAFALGHAGAFGWTSDWVCDIRARVPSDLDAKTLGAVITVVAAGFAVMPHQDCNEVGGWAETPVRSADAEIDEIPALTPREREVLALLAEGASNKAIARALSVSVHTAKFHVASLSEKLGASGRLEAVAIAIRAGLVMV